MRVDGVEVTTLAEPDAAALRRRRLGFVFQAFHVLPHLSVFPQRRAPFFAPAAAPDATRVHEVLAAVGLDGLGAAAAAALGGRLQRVAIAARWCTGRHLILADEPTGNLDPATAERVIDLLAVQVRSEGAACVLVTHSRRAAAARADRVLVLAANGDAE